MNVERRIPHAEKRIIAPWNEEKSFQARLEKEFKKAEMDFKSMKKDTKTDSRIRSDHFFDSLGQTDSNFSDRSFNDVCNFADINIDEEKQKGVGKVGAITRSCGDTYLMVMEKLKEKIDEICKKHYVKPTKDIAALTSHAFEEHLKNVVEDIIEERKLTEEPNEEMPPKKSRMEEKSSKVNLEHWQSLIQNDPALRKLYRKTLMKSYFF